jgi:hypothetical protein
MNKRLGFGALFGALIGAPLGGIGVMLTFIAANAMLRLGEPSSPFQSLNSYSLIGWVSLLLSVTFMSYAIGAIPAALAGIALERWLIFAEQRPESLTNHWMTTLLIGLTLGAVSTLLCAFALQNVFDSTHTSGKFYWAALYLGAAGGLFGTLIRMRIRLSRWKKV